MESSARPHPAGYWDEVARKPAPSWYLDDVVARQKRDAHLKLIRMWARPSPPRRLLKTDLFEDAFGQDRLLDGLDAVAAVRIGIDVAWETARAARARDGSGAIQFLAADTRQLPLADSCLGLIVSNSTLDHFDSAAEFETAVGELARVLEPGGRLIITMDNLANPLYFPLRWMSALGAAPFRLGYTTTRKGLAAALSAAGLKVLETGTLIHNPRMISTLLFLLLRRALGLRAGAPIGALLGMFELLERLPTRGLTACFVAACAEKP